VGFFGNSPSSNVSLYDFAIYGDTEYRDDAAADSGIGGGLSNTIVQNLWIEHTKCGIWVDGPMDGFHVTGITIRNTWADGVNFHRGVTNSIIEQSMLRTTGDDSLAMWTDAIVDSKNTFRFNTITNPVLANGLAIYGGSDNSITDNYVADSLCEGGAIQVSNRFNSIALSGTTTVARNTAVRCGAPNHDNSNHNGALWFWAQQYEMNAVINITDLQVSDSSYAGVTFWGSKISQIYFTNVTFDTAPYALEVFGVSGQAFFTDVTAKNLANGGVYSCDQAFVLNSVSGNSGWNDTHCN